jgi:hypothetical protein
MPGLVPGILLQITAAAKFSPHPEERFAEARLEGCRPAKRDLPKHPGLVVRDASLRDAPHHEG